MICPVITALLGYFMLNEKLTNVQWAAVALCTISCVLMGINSSLELGYSFLTAFTYALYLVSQRRNQGFDRMIMLGIQVLFSFVILNLFFNVLVTELPSGPRFYGYTFMIAVVFTVLPLFLNLFALNKINSATIGILLYLNPIFNFSIAFIVFKEKRQHDSDCRLFYYCDRRFPFQLSGFQKSQRCYDRKTYLTH